MVGNDLLDEPQFGDAEGSVLELDALIAVRTPHADAPYNAAEQMFSGFSSPHALTR